MRTRRVETAEAKGAQRCGFHVTRHHIRIESLPGREHATLMHAALRAGELAGWRWDGFGSHSSHSVHGHPSRSGLPMAQPAAHFKQGPAPIERTAARLTTNVVSLRATHQPPHQIDPQPAHANVVTLRLVCGKREALWALQGVGLGEL